MVSPVLKVSQLTQQIKELLEKNFPFIWVEGEISNLTIHSTGHLFFTLKDEVAQIRAIMFRSLAQLLLFQPENGIQVIVRGRINVYEPRGEYQILTDFIAPLGKGSLQIAFEQIKKKLEAEGLFASSRKKPLPLLLQKIGIITSPTGAAIRDILRIIEQRFINLEILIFPVRVQGVEAPEEIIQALELANSFSPNLDVVILTRGGGSLEDLWAFNDEKLARAISRCRIPVVSAVGHEIDFTIADFVADVRVPTPTAAAELIVEKWTHLSLKNDDLTQRILNLTSQVMEKKREKFNYLQRLFFFLSPYNRIKNFQIELTQKEEKLRSQICWMLERGKGKLEKFISQLDSANPLHILKRGYSITRSWPQNEVIRNANSLRPQQKITVKFYKGEIFCQVEKIKPD